MRPVTRVLHPERDLRERFSRVADVASPYTADRIRQSYAAVGAILADCPEVRGSLAMDVGCGAGFDTFALGMYFDRVVGVDTDRAAIREARRVAARMGITHASFECGRAEDSRLLEACDYIHCNLMSHHTPSRIALLRHLAAHLRPRGYLNYTEVTEGYGPMEGHRAIRRRDPAELAQRCRQVLYGFTGTRGLRFFLAGTAAAIVPLCGLTIVRGGTRDWNGLPYLEKLILRREIETGGTIEPEGDYLDLPPDFAAAGREIAQGMADLRRGPLPPEAKRRILEQAGRRENAFSPYLRYLLIADAARSWMDFEPGSVWGRVARRALSRFRPPRPEPDWTELEGLDRELLRCLRHGAGSSHGPED
jgi:SAM-dependent methyltransferase